MSLCAREQHALSEIAAALRRSDPGLAARIVSFNELSGGEEMPLRERLQPRYRLAGTFLVLVLAAAALVAGLMGALSRAPGSQCPSRPAAATVWHGPLVSSGACPATSRVTKPAPFGRSGRGGTG